MGTASTPEPPEGLTEITGRIDGLAEAIKRMEARDAREARRKAPVTPPQVEERRSLYRTVGWATVAILALFVALAALSMLLRAGVLH
jgi:hypothetical protein